MALEMSLVRWSGSNILARETRTDTSKSEIRGFFAPLRMTA
jgi:hypothetical protein